MPPPPPPHTTRRWCREATDVAAMLLLFSPALEVFEVFQPCMLMLMPTFNAHPNSLTLCSRRRRQFSSVETRRLSPRPSRYLSLTRTALGGLEPRLTHSQADIIISQPPFLLLLLSSLPGRGQSSVGRREVKSPPQIEIGSVAFAVCLPRRQSRCEYERGGTTTRS